MRWALGALFVFGASAGMIAAILRVRRRAPEGGYFDDGDRAGVVACKVGSHYYMLVGAHDPAYDQFGLGAAFLFGGLTMMAGVAVFMALIVWTWLWGVAGALLAVPLLATFKICCDHIEPLNPIGTLLGR